MSDTTITPEERQSWRDMFEMVKKNPSQHGMIIPQNGMPMERLLNALEQAEARVHELEGSLSSSISKQSEMADGIELVVKANHALATKAQEAEAENERLQQRVNELLSEELTDGAVRERIQLRFNMHEVLQQNARLTKMVDWLANQLDCPPKFTNCAVDCAECRKDAARRAVDAGEE